MLTPRFAQVETWAVELGKRFEYRTSFSCTQGDSECKPQWRDDDSPYSKLCQWKDSKTGKGLSFTERASEILDHIIAGQDPVPAALEFILKQLSVHQDVQSCLQSELSASRSLIENQGFACIDKLRYLNGVVMEGLRLLDSIASYQTRVVPRGGCHILGVFIPAGVRHCPFPGITFPSLAFPNSARC